MSKMAVEKKNTHKQKKIMVFGTFDGIHPGHLNFFAQARKLASNPFLVVSVARDKNVFKIKGRYPKRTEGERKGDLEACELADKVVLGGVQNHLPHILRERPAIIALGYDQEAYVKNLKADLKKLGLSPKFYRLKPFKKNIYKSHLLEA